MQSGSCTLDSLPIFKVVEHVIRRLLLFLPFFFLSLHNVDRCASLSLSSIPIELSSFFDGRPFGWCTFSWRGNIILGHRSILWTTFHPNIHRYTHTQTNTLKHAQLIIILALSSRRSRFLYCSSDTWCMPVYMVDTYSLLYSTLVYSNWMVIWMRILFPNYKQHIFLSHTFT